MKAQNNISVNNVNIVYHKRKNRRPLRHKVKIVSNKLKVLSCNASGLRNKLPSLSKIISDLQLSMFCIQETHFLKEGSIKFDNFQIFEKTRETKSGGGLLVGALKDLNPIWIGDGGSTAEAMSIKVSVKDMDIRVVNAYGPQEYADNEKKTCFWEYLDNEAFLANVEGTGLYVAMDANSWLGDEILKGDPHKQNKNGEMFQNFLERNPQLVVLNTETFCEGLITRSRAANDKVEHSVIDFVIVCDKVLSFINKFTIDEQKKYALANNLQRGKLFAVITIL